MCVNCSCSVLLLSLWSLVSMKPTVLPSGENINITLMSIVHQQALTINNPSDFDKNNTGKIPLQDLQVSIYTIVK